MRISGLLRDKGDFVATVAPEATVSEVLAELAEHGVGALVVTGDGAQIAGIVSERDIVRALHHRGIAILSEPVAGSRSWTLPRSAPESVRAPSRILPTSELSPVTSRRSLATEYSRRAARGSSRSRRIHAANCSARRA